jgi:hypothetical protein
MEARMTLSRLSSAVILTLVFAMGIKLVVDY